MRVVHSTNNKSIGKKAAAADTGRPLLLAFFSFMIGRQTCLSGSLFSINAGTQEFWKIRTKAATESRAFPLAYQDSFGLFDNISDIDWEQIRLNTKASSWYWNPNSPLENVTDAPSWNRHNMNPNFECPRLEKAGGSERGETKFVCNPQRLMYDGKEGGCLIYSFGCAGDFKFEDAIFAMHGGDCEIHVFDPANWERPGDKERKNIHYHAWGLKSTYDDSSSVVWPKGRGGGFKTFPETLDLLGHQNRTIDIFKIDCEGCEWSTYKDWIEHDIRQILIETHGVPTPQGTPKARWYKKPLDVSQYYKQYSDNGYALFSKDPNGELSLELCFIKLDKGFWNRPMEAIQEPKPEPRPKSPKS